LDNLDLATIKGKQKWDEPIRERFPMSEEDATSNLNSFFSEGFHRYEKERSRADIDCATSKLSAHLRIGTLSPNELYYKVEDSDLDYEDKKTFSRRLFWRDLAYFQLLNFPTMREDSIRCHYDTTEWVTGEEEERRFNAWKSGKTGYPLVDAGMRELYATGWMTQSVRMVVASFLTEYLRVNWVKGCEWFHYTLVDADSAINAMMWQNAGRSGIDQWNFVMSPVAASQDGTGSYTKKWIPELSKLKKPLLHKPWEASNEILNDAGIVLGETYPHRIVTDLKGEKEISDKNVLAMRGRHQEFNNDRGYDLVKIGDKDTVVFTKKQFRIDQEGLVMKGGPKKRAKNKTDKSKLGLRGRARG
jgi:deoxyribodipyrimidine photolyase